MLLRRHVDRHRPALDSAFDRLVSWWAGWPIAGRIESPHLEAASGQEMVLEVDAKLAGCPGKFEFLRAAWDGDCDAPSVRVSHLSTTGESRFFALHRHPKKFCHLPLQRETSRLGRRLQPHARVCDRIAHRGREVRVGSKQHRYAVARVQPGSKSARKRSNQLSYEPTGRICLQVITPPLNHCP